MVSPTTSEIVANFESLMQTSEVMNLEFKLAKPFVKLMRTNCAATYYRNYFYEGKIKLNFKLCFIRLCLINGSVSSLCLVVSPYQAFPKVASKSELFIPTFLSSLQDF